MTVNLRNIFVTQSKKRADAESQKRPLAGAFILVGAASFPLIFVVALVLGQTILKAVMIALVLASPVTLGIVVLATALANLLCGD